MKNIPHLVLIFTLLIHSSCAKGQQGTDCVFDPSSITSEFISSNPNVESFKWFEDTKEAAILMKSGEYVYLKKWACVSYGMEAKKIVITPLIANESSSFWIGALLEFGKQFLDKGDYEHYASTIKQNNWLKDGKIMINSKHEVDIPHDNYPEFYAGIERKKDMIIMTFSYYMN